MTSFLAEPGLAIAKLGDILLTPFGLLTVRAEKLALFWVFDAAVAVSVMIVSTFSYDVFSTFLSLTGPHTRARL